MTDDLVDVPLFELPGGAAVATAEHGRRLPQGRQSPAKLSPDQARTQRQAATLRHGRHPLGSKLHPQAAPADDRKADGPRCRGCVHVQAQPGTSGRYLKCDAHVVTRGPGTDLRLWWPACERRE